MIKEYTLQGLDCANCANKIENAVQSMEGITSASVNFITTSLKLETKETYNGDISIDIEKVVHKYEPDVMVIDKVAGTDLHINHAHECHCGHEHSDEHSHEHNHEHNHEHSHEHSHEQADNMKKRIALIIAGAIVFFAGLIIDKVLEPAEYISFAVYLLSYIILGAPVLLRAAKNIIHGQLLDENFLMSIATIGAFIIRDFAEAAAVMLFYQVGELFQDAAVRKSKASIADLMDIRPDFANLKSSDKVIKVSPETVNPGDIIIVKPGEKIPLDGVVLEGESMLDTSALTGESVPRRAKPSESVISGCINLDGVLTIRVTKTFGESTVAKIIDLVQNAGSKKAPTENFITTFSRYYTPVVVGVAALLAIIPPLFLGQWAEWLNRGLIFLVISCPCALLISIPLGFFGGIGNASKKGILVKGGNYLEALNKLDIVVFDKTGTLTKGLFEVTEIQPKEDFTEENLIKCAAYAEAYSNHPIATSILNAYGKQINKEILEDYREVPGHGISVKVDDKKILAGNSKLMISENISYSASDSMGTKVYIAVDGKYAGCIVISDELKPDSKMTIADLKKAGVRKTVMLTGDNSLIGNTIADELKLDEVYTELLPHQKVEKLEELDNQKLEKYKLAYVGEGINDAPVLARADIGIAMGGLGSDAAVEAADVVLMKDNPSSLLEAIKIAKATKRIVWQNIIFALGVKGFFLLIGAFGIATMWEAVFADVGVAVIAILNAMRVLKMK